MDEKQVKKVARNVSYHWPGVVEPDDLEQLIWLFILERPSTQRHLGGLDEHSRYRALSKIGHELASKERASYDVFSGNFRYSVDEVKYVLSKGVLIEDLTGWDEAVHDLMEGLEVLVTRSPQYVDAITSRYADMEYPKGDAKVTLSRALTAVTDEMNKSNKRRHADEPGMRKAVSNAAARAISSSQYEGVWDYEAHL